MERYRSVKRTAPQRRFEFNEVGFLFLIRKSHHGDLGTKCVKETLVYGGTQNNLRIHLHMDAIYLLSVLDSGNEIGDLLEEKREINFVESTRITPHHVLNLLDQLIMSIAFSMLRTNVFRALDGNILKCVSSLNPLVSAFTSGLKKNIKKYKTLCLIHKSAKSDKNFTLERFEGEMVWTKKGTNL